jgi:hypothetical protein
VLWRKKRDRRESGRRKDEPAAVGKEQHQRTVVERKREREREREGDKEKERGGKGKDGDKDECCKEGKRERKREGE